VSAYRNPIATLLSQSHGESVCNMDVVEGPGELYLRLRSELFVHPTVAVSKAFDFPEAQNGLSSSR
jgi:hypothetical protein